MPELPEVETTKQSLMPLLEQHVQHVTVRNASLRWPIPDDLARLNGQKLCQLSRRSKYILAQFEHDTMLWHLGMSGSFRLCEKNSELRKHDHLIIEFDDIELRYHDPRRFGCILWLDEHSQNKLIDTLGPEPLSDEFTKEYLTEKITKERRKYYGISFLALFTSWILILYFKALVIGIISSFEFGQFRVLESLAGYSIYQLWIYGIFGIIHGIVGGYFLSKELKNI